MQNVNIAILHLSDIHFKVKDNIILSRVEKIVSSLKRAGINYQDVVIVFSGDVAYSGLKSEYEVAEIFFDSLSENLLKSGVAKSLNFIFVPGNHDCDLKSIDQTAKLLRENINSIVKIENETIENICKPQREYFEFIRKYSPESSEFKGISKLYNCKSILLNEKTILFHCLNTAWLSSLDEASKKMYFPINNIDFEDSKNADLVFSIFHHAYSWFNAEVGDQIREKVEANSDIILSGHEHKVKISENNNLISNENTFYLQGK